MIEYKGYAGVMEIDAEAGVIFGRVIGLRDVITFQGETVAEAVRAFRDSVDDYLEWCAEKGDTPVRPFSGKFVLRVSPDLHRTLATAAEARKKSLNSLVVEALAERFLQGGAPERPEFGGSGVEPIEVERGNPAVSELPGPVGSVSVTAGAKGKTPAQIAGERMAGTGGPSRPRRKSTPR